MYASTQEHINHTWRQEQIMKCSIDLKINHRTWKLLKIDSVMNILI